MVKELAHVSFKVSDMKKSLEFYVDKMGFRKAFDIVKSFDGENDLRRQMSPKMVMQDSCHTDRKRLWLTYIEAAPGQFIELFNIEGYEKQGMYGNDNIGYLHFALIVDDIFAFRNEIVSRGVTLKTEPEMGIEGTYQMWVADPDGNEFECMQYTENSAQITYKMSERTDENEKNIRIFQQ